MFDEYINERNLTTKINNDNISRSLYDEVSNEENK